MALSGDELAHHFPLLQFTQAITFIVSHLLASKTQFLNK